MVLLIYPSSMATLLAVIRHSAAGPFNRQSYVTDGPFLMPVWLLACIRCMFLAAVRGRWPHLRCVCLAAGGCRRPLAPYQMCKPGRWPP